MNIKENFNRDHENKKATAMVLDLRNSTALHRKLHQKGQRELIVKMMIGIHKKILNYLYEHSGIKETEFAFNDTGDGYLIVFRDKSHAFSCVLCATHLRDYLHKHISKFNNDLNISHSNLKYGFGIGIHTAYARFIEMEYKTVNKKSVSKKYILGNAANSAARVEEVTKIFLDIDLLITGDTRKESYRQASPKYKELLKKDGEYIHRVGEVRYNVMDSKPNGHELYTISSQFYQNYKKIETSRVLYH